MFVAWTRWVLQVPVGVTCAVVPEETRGEACKAGLLGCCLFGVSQRLVAVAAPEHPSTAVAAAGVIVVTRVRTRARSQVSAALAAAWPWTRTIVGNSPAGKGQKTLYCVEDLRSSMRFPETSRGPVEAGRVKRRCVLPGSLRSCESH